MPTRSAYEGSSRVRWISTDHNYGRAFVPPIGGIGYARVTLPHQKSIKAGDGYIYILSYTEGH